MFYHEMHFTKAEAQIVMIMIIYKTSIPPSLHFTMII